MAVAEFPWLPTPLTPSFCSNLVVCLQKEMLPFDAMEDTREQLRSGFGLVHKWEKRKKEAAEDAAKVERWTKDGHTRTKAKSKFGGSVDSGESAPPPPSPIPFALPDVTDDGEGGVGASAVHAPPIALQGPGARTT